MKLFAQLLERIIDRVNVNLRTLGFDVRPYVRVMAEYRYGGCSFACYGLSTYHPIHLQFDNSSLSGSYFLGRCKVRHSVLMRSDIRGDELKKKGQVWEIDDIRIPLYHDEIITIRNSFLDTTLVHSNSHSPESPEEFPIRNTVAMPYANIHGAPIEGSFIGTFGTVDLTCVRNCVIGHFAYVLAGEVRAESFPPGTILLRSGGAWEFRYTYDPAVLNKYIRHEEGEAPEGLFIDFAEPYEDAFAGLFASARQGVYPAGAGSFVSRYAVKRGETSIANNVLVAQRAYLENATMHTGSNAQEKCYIIDSVLGPRCVAAHGAKIVGTHLEEHIFVGFNCFLHGTAQAPLTIGRDCIVMPHTIIDLEEPVHVPANRLVWGIIRRVADLEENSIDLDELATGSGDVRMGRMSFRGDAADFVRGFRGRIDHILQENGAFWDGHDEASKGHSQNMKYLTFNIIQPYADGDAEGLYPTIDIRPIG